MQSIIFNDHIYIANKILKQFIAIEKTIEFNKTNLHKIFIKNQLNKSKKVKKQIYKKKVI